MKDKIQYLTFDSLQEGVGASQVLNYLLHLSKDFEITLFNFEKEVPRNDLKVELSESGINWRPLYFGQKGLISGIARVIRLSNQVDVNLPIHARGDLAALAAVYSGSRKILWDCRALTADQRLALSDSLFRYPIYLLNSFIERTVAKKSQKINVITSHAASILRKKYKQEHGKFSKVSTCVDLDKFPLTKMPKLDPIKLFIPGTLSNAYDIDLMNSIIKEIRKTQKLEVTVAVGKGADKNWIGLDFDNFITLQHSEIASEIAKSHFGMSIWKSTLGICLASVSSTKIPEFLASGRPVIANFNQGDIGSLIEDYRCGISTSLSHDGYIKQYVMELFQLLDDKDLPSRCRRLAENEYSLTDGVDRLTEVYKELISGA